MSKKYIIEIERDPYEVLNPDGITSKKLWKASSFNSLVFDKNGLDKLTPYSEDEVYAKGHEHGYINGHEAADKAGAKFYDDGYQRGLNDAWKAARKLALDPNHGGYSFEELDACFGKEWKNYYKLFKDYPVEDIVEKIREYEERTTHEDEEIKVGDEVEYMDSGDSCSCRFVVTHINPEVNPIRYSGITTFDDEGVMAIGEANYCDADMVRKTGRHVDLSELFGGKDV